MSPRIYKKWIPEVATGSRRMEIKEEDIEYNPAWEKDGIKIVGELLPLKARLPALREGFVQHQHHHYAIFTGAT